MLVTLAREALPDTAVVDVVDSALTARPLRVLAPLPLDPDNSDGDALTGFARASVPEGALVRRMPPYLGVHHPPPVRSTPPHPLPYPPPRTQAPPASVYPLLRMAGDGEVCRGAATEPTGRWMAPQC
jgi:hypothetical protein